jgi:hypothetical protein
MAEFEIRPPTHFRFINHDEATNTYYWVGPVRADETYAQLFVIITDLSDQEIKSSLEKLFEDPIDAIRRRRDNWKDSGVERGHINDHPFVRTSWTGTVTATARKGLAGRTMHGVAYLGVFGKRGVLIQYQDVAPDHAESLKLGEAAASTFRRAKSTAGVTDAEAKLDAAGATPEQALRTFLIAMLLKDEATLRTVTLPTEDFDWLLRGQAVPADQGEKVKAEVSRQPIRALKPGDEITLPGNRTLTVQPEAVNADNALLLPEGASLPHPVVNVDGRWRVDASSIIAGRKAAAARKNTQPK